MRRQKQSYQKYGKQNVEPGFGQNYADGTRRLINKGGSFKYYRLNTMRSIYVDLIKMGWKRFLTYVVVFYIIVNLILGFTNFIIGPEQIHLNNIQSKWYQYAELPVMVKAHDDSHSQTNHGNTSYMADEFVWGAKFVPSYYTGANGNAIFEISKLGDYKEVPLNISVIEQSTTNN